MRWNLLLFLAIFAVSVSGYTLSDYPDYFVHNGKFDPVYVIGVESPSLDVVAATVISTGIARYNLTPRVTSGRVDDEIGDITKHNAIVVGNPCVNSAAAKLEGNPEPCDAGLEGSTGYIKFFESDDGVQILITGLTGEDRRAAAEYLAEEDMSEVTGRIKSVDSNSGSKPGQAFEEWKKKIEELKQQGEEEEETEEEPEEIETNQTEEAEPVKEVEQEDNEAVLKALEEIREKRAKEEQGGLITSFFRAIWRFLTWLF